MKEALLVLLGALISCGTTLFLEWLRYRREEKLYYKRKKEEAYIEMQDFLVDCCAHWNELKTGYVSVDIRLKYNSIRTKAHIYAKRDITDEFYDIANSLMTGKREHCNDRNDKLIAMIKEDLKIEDK